MAKKRKFEDEVLYITLESNGYITDNNLTALFFKGKIKGILEMSDGQIYYFIDGDRFDVYRNEKMNKHIGVLQKIPSQYCFDDPKELLNRVKQLLLTRVGKKV